jgi:hypothetical protein
MNLKKCVNYNEQDERVPNVLCSACKIIMMNHLMAEILPNISSGSGVGTR